MPETKKHTPITDNYAPSYIQELCNNLGCNPAEVLITICNDVTRTSKVRISAAKELNAMLRSPEKHTLIAPNGPYGLIQLVSSE